METMVVTTVTDNSQVTERRQSPRLTVQDSEVEVVTPPKKRINVIDLTIAESDTGSEADSEGAMETGSLDGESDAEEQARQHKLALDILKQDLARCQGSGKPRKNGTDQRNPHNQKHKDKSHPCA
jgi:hypothetical protein